MGCEQNDMGPFWSEGLDFQCEVAPHPLQALFCMLTEGPRVTDGTQQDCEVSEYLLRTVALDSHLYHSGLCVSEK